LVPEVVDRGEFVLVRALYDTICGYGLGEIPAIRHKRDSTASLFNLLLSPLSQPALGEEGASTPSIKTMEEGRDGVESVAQMCNFIPELFCVQRSGGGRERF